MVRESPGVRSLRAERLLGYRPTHTLGAGLDESMGWYMESAL